MSSSTSSPDSLSLVLVVAISGIVLTAAFLLLLGPVTTLSFLFAWPLAARISLGCGGGLFALLFALLASGGDLKDRASRFTAVREVAGTCAAFGLLAFALSIILVGREANQAEAVLRRAGAVVAADGDRIVLAAPAVRDSLSVFGHRVNVETNDLPDVWLDLADARRLSELWATSKDRQLAKGATRLAVSAAR